MICCGSGSDFGKVSAFGSDPDNIKHRSPNQKKVAFSLSEAALFLRKLAYHFRFFDFFILTFYVGSGSKSGSGTVMHSCSGSAKAKVAFLQFLSRFHNTDWGSAYVLMRIRIQLFTFCYSGQFLCSLHTQYGSGSMRAKSLRIHVDPDPDPQH
jgi:hypothetical protein